MVKVVVLHVIDCRIRIQAINWNLLKIAKVQELFCEGISGLIRVRVTRFAGIETTNGGLYSQFDGKLDLLSSLAEKKVKAEVLPKLDKIYQKSAKLLDNPFVDVLDDDDIDKNQKMTTIEKLNESLEPYSNELKKNTNRKRFSQHEDSYDFQTSAKDMPLTERKYRTILDATLRNKQSSMPERNKYASVNIKWPAIAEGRGITNLLEEKSILSPNQLSPVSSRFKTAAEHLKKRSRKSKHIRKRFNAGMPLLDPRPVMNSASSLYPGVIARTPDTSPVNMAPKVAMSGSGVPLTFDVNALAAAAANLPSPAATSPNSYPSLNQIKDIQQFLQNNSPRQVESSPVDTPYKTSGSKCDRTGISTNVSDMLERVLSDLDAIKNTKMANLTADGLPCKIAGFWNSEIAGVRFDLTVSSNATNAPSDLGVQITKRRWKRKDSIMGSSWSCSGTTLGRMGGPFYLAARKKGDSGMATFTGFCMTCGGSDVVFGAWTFVNPCRNCTDASLSIDTKRDIFRRDMEEEKKAHEKEVKQKAKFHKIEKTLKDKTTECEENESANSFSSDTFYEYF